MVHNLFRLHDFNVRYGETPGDSLVQIAYVATLDASTNVIQTKFAPGTKVVVVPFLTQTVDSNGQLTLAANPEPAAAGSGGYLIIAQGYALQGGIQD